MSDRTDVDPVERALGSHEAFEARGSGAYALSTTVFDAVTSGRTVEGTHEFDAAVTVPTLSAAVDGEAVADVVEDGWFGTFERRVADAYDVAGAATDRELAVERDGDVVRVEFAYAAADAGRGVADAKALIEFVEGTYVQGIVPGYEYRGPAATLLENARERGQGATSDGAPM